MSARACHRENPNFVASRTADRCIQRGASGQSERLILSNSEAGEQVTRWVYGTTLTESEVAVHNLLGQDLPRVR